MDTKEKCSGLSCNSYHIPSEYESLVGAFQYLSFTRPDNAYAFQQVYMFMHDPHTQPMASLKQISRYIKGTTHIGLHLFPSLVDTLATIYNILSSSF
jgi:hypothetical protein